MSSEIKVSKLGHTWIIDVDGTIVKHNGYLDDGYDSILDGVKEFFSSIPVDDMIIFLTSRHIEEKGKLIEFLEKNHIRFNHIICDAPYGERILINDNKPSGLKTAIAVNKKRDHEIDFICSIDDSL